MVTTKITGERIMKGLALGLVLGAQVTVSTVHAAGDAFSTLRTAVQQDRKQNEEAFLRLESLRMKVEAGAPPWERRSGVTRQIRALGPSAVMPALALLSYDEEKLAKMTDMGRVMFTVGLLELLRQVKDPRGAQVLRHVMEKTGQHAMITQTAAEALGALCRGEDVGYLAGHVRAGGALLKPALMGLGYCRSGASADVLLGQLTASNDEVRATAADALGWLGSRWAWEAKGPAAQAEGDALRARITEALVPAYLGSSKETRVRFRRAILMVDHPAATTMLTGVTLTDAPAQHDVEKLRSALRRSEARH
ncbi:MAG: HEAT repeat domain-containing protein [Myxococcota bacterium]